MTMQKIAFDAERLNNGNAVDLRCSDTSWLPDADTFEHHATSEGPQVIGKLVHINNGTSKLGMWYKNGEPAIGFDNLPTLEMWDEVAMVDERIGFINLYRAYDNDVGFTVGSRVCLTREDAEARGRRNTTGNYITTIEVKQDININA